MTASPRDAATAARAAAGRAAIEKRWAPYREARLKAGLPPTKAAAERRKPAFLGDEAEEDYWMSEAVRLGLGNDSTHRTTLRRVARRLADVAAAQIAAEVAMGGDEDLLEAYYAAEERRWRASADRHANFAHLHERYASEAAYMLAALRMGRQ